uniref:CDC20/Fizzy WD40 domain-containing protein n=1 Tax=Musa acuminata subsp. malaccensis TaxID=214687 RepID=A0A804IF05_MUSAM|nr:PREDICTED: cell division cycle 20.1, cofactor of APC complex-like isoform X1 [Musa acuminata subsp. malaccensis]XP_018679563.1 PREDICTED: cell division cycle 20.1, cofactor of APC complex-like isoform X1 [Musa acuminata subsp. malaccensis]XP_018679564.1 PREDICTED: cell division cycle 20.1, cofactor of APC complex-like isoform X1 [Musa acuminata subsp. malaccensis]XP_018679565.1 PREDICTED: cell division cycle 20.1, cofactor of APC complex-like isoform X1 [Musa acuminata subsp. malaccensis]XP_
MATSRPRRIEYDRFIPFRSAMDMDFAHYALTTPSRPGAMSSRSAYQKLLDQCVLKNRSRILAFKSAPAAPADEVPQFYDANLQQQRKIPDKPEKVLEVYGMLDNFSYNLLDWGSNNMLAIGLDDTVCLWDAANESASVLQRALDGNGPITSVSWCPDGKFLAFALGSSDLALVDGSTGRVLDGVSGDKQSKVLSLAWRSNSVLTAGKSDGSVIDYDFRKPDHAICDYKGHELGVCNLKWSGLSGRYLASGGQDKLVHIWDACMAVPNDCPRRHQWLHRLSGHTSTVKALDWCPTRSNLLASGGGRYDRRIKFWNTIDGACLNTFNTGSEVCSLLWDTNKSELLTSHGFPKNQLILWNYPSMKRAAELSAHSSRVLFIARSPVGGTVASAAADETVKFWNIFEASKCSVPFARFNVIR